MANKKNTASQVRNAVEKVISDMGYSLWDVTLYKEGPELILEIAIDKKGGVSIDDCSLITKAVDPIIDELDPIEEGYSLLVSSAGSSREIRTPEHLNYAASEKLDVDVRLFTAFEGIKEYGGKIKSFDSEFMIIEQAESEIKLPRKLISKITANIEI
jgi:ribosome maturation factor RimP